MRLSLIQHKLELLSTRYRLALSFGFVVALILGLDTLFQVLFSERSPLDQLLPKQLMSQSLEIGFAPEVWLSVVGLTLGTLVIVISIAAQNIPKIADLYRKDWISLVFIWFVMAGSTHAIYLKFFQDTGMVSRGSLILNLFVLLPIAILAGFPYIFYVLKNIQPETVIAIIVRRHLSLVHCLSEPSIQAALKVNKSRSAYHRTLLDSLNQLENMFSYVTFKEPKAQILQTIGDLLQDYIWMKPGIGTDFFKLSSEIRQDIAFQTMTDQFTLMEQGRTFYEQKCFRILGNAYLMLLNAHDFDLASLCGAKVEQVGLTAMKANDAQLLAVTVIRMNTFMRFALKHGKAHDEARHLYNLVYHYRRFVEHLIAYDQKEHAQRCVFYLRSYGNEAYQHGRHSPPLLFIVDVIAAELRKILIGAFQARWPLSIQRSLLLELLQVDSPPELDQSSLEPRQTNTGVRILQISLALFYLEVGLEDFVDLIIADILDDQKILGPKTFQEILLRTCDRMTKTAPDYWEATDRGTQNLYYSPHTKHMPDFLRRVQRHLA